MGAASQSFSPDLPPLGVEPTRPVIAAARARAIIAFLALAAGLSIARAWPGVAPSAWLAVAAILVAGPALLALARPGRAVRLLGPALALALTGLGAATASLHALDPVIPRLETALAGNDLEARPVRVRGVLLEDPMPIQRPGGAPLTTLAGFIPSIEALSARLRTEAVLTETGWARASGRVRLRLQLPREARPPELRAGDRVELTGRYFPITGPANPGQPDARLWARATGHAGSITIPDPALIALAPSSGPGPPDIPSFSPGGPAVMAGPLFAVSSGGPGQMPGPSASGDRFIDRLDRSLLRFRADLHRRAAAILGPAPQPTSPPHPGRTLLADLLLGLESPADPRLSQAFTRLGLAHVLAISGFHLVVLAAVSLALLRLTGDRGPLEPAIVAAAVVAYLLIVPASAPVLRSGAMVLTLLAAEMLGRRYDRLTLLAWTATVLLLIRPADLWSLGFQLSYGLTGLLLWLGPRFHTALFGIRLRGTLDGARRGPVESARRLVSTSLLCWAVAAPAIAWHTGLFSPLAVLSTLLITPLILALLWAGFAGLLLGAIAPALARLLSPALLAAGDLTATLVHTLDALPGVSVRVPLFSLGLAAAATGVLLYWIRFAHRRDAVAWVLTATVSAWAAIELAGPGQRGLGQGVELRVDVLDAGRGSCAIIRTPEAAVLWDCGGGPSFGRLDLPRAARALNAGRVRTAILAHSDLAHFSSILDAADSLGLREVLITPALPARARAEPQGPAAVALRALRDRGVTVRALHAGDEIDLGRARLRVLSPPVDSPWEGDDLRSLIAVVERRADGASLLLTGQLADDAVARLVEAGGLPRRPVIVLPARGSPRALRELLIECDPRAILAGGEEATDFGGVWGGEAAVRQTAESGAISASLTAEGWKVEPAR